MIALHSAYLRGFQRASEWDPTGNQYSPAIHVDDQAMVCEEMEAMGFMSLQILLRKGKKKDRDDDVWESKSQCWDMFLRKLPARLYPVRRLQDACEILRIASVTSVRCIDKGTDVELPLIISYWRELQGMREYPVPFPFLESRWNSWQQVQQRQDSEFQ